MKPFRDRADAELAILAVLPGREQALARLRRLAEKGRLPVVCVVGKYNHGKSRLLNELVGEPLATTVMPCRPHGSNPTCACSCTRRMCQARITP